MPFTFSHPAIVLPLMRRRAKKIFSSTGLIVGSIIPDFESFIRFDQHKQYSHTWLGVFWFNLPLAILFAFIFHSIVRDPLIKNLPRPIGARFYEYLRFDWNAFFRRHFVMVIYSTLIGIVSHLLWDAFTHLNLADPNATTSQLRVGGHRLYILLQYACSLIGLAVVAWYIIRLPEYKTAPFHTNKLQYWAIAATVACITIATSIYLIDEPINPVWLIEIGISGVLLSLIVAPLAQKFIFRV